jgi:hypothetical protein
MQATARGLSVVSATPCAGRRLIRVVPREMVEIVALSTGSRDPVGQPRRVHDPVSECGHPPSLGVGGGGPERRGFDPRGAGPKGAEGGRLSAKNPFANRGGCFSSDDLARFARFSCLAGQNPRYRRCSSVRRSDRSWSPLHSLFAPWDRGLRLGRFTNGFLANSLHQRGACSKTGVRRGASRFSAWQDATSERGGPLERGATRPGGKTAAVFQHQPRRRGPTFQPTFQNPRPSRFSNTP